MGMTSGAGIETAEKGQIKIRLSVLSLMLFIAACQAEGPTRGDSTGAPVTQSSKKAPLAATQGWAGCSTTCTPRVELLDALASDTLKVGEDGNYKLPARKTGTRYLALSAPGHIPQLVRLEGGMSPPSITLKSSKDPRKAYLFGVTVAAVVGGRQYDRSTLRPVADKDIVITRGRARIELRSDAQGEFIKALPAGHYEVLIDSRRHAVDLPQQESLFLPLRLGRTMVD